MTEALRVRRGAGWRYLTLCCLAFAGCAAYDHKQCADFPSIFGPCSWARSLWEAAKTLAFSAASTALLMVASLWVCGLISFRGRRP